MPAALMKIVGAIGFEPTTSRSRTERSTRLSHAPKTDVDKNRMTLKTKAHIMGTMPVCHRPNFCNDLSFEMTAQEQSALLELPPPVGNAKDVQDFDLWIEAGRSEKNYWRDLWRYRELFYFLAWRDILVRYKQTVIGIAWALIRPFLTMLIFTVVFNKVAKLSAPGAVPYALLVFAAMLPWQFFATALGESSNSLISNANLISKVLLPAPDRAGGVGDHQLR